MEICRLGWVSGRVQGVGFRHFVYKAASAAKLRGWARNLPDGRVEVMLCGESSLVDAVAAKVETGPLGSRVDQAEWEQRPFEPLADFLTG